MAETVEIPQLRIIEKIDETPEFDASTGENPFAKVKGVITELISRLEEEDLDANTAKHSFKLETVVSHTVDGEIPMLQSEFDALSKRQLHVGTVRAGERDVFAKVNADLEQVACETCVKDNMAVVAKVGDLSSTSGSMHQQHTSGQAGKEERGKKMEGREGKEKGKKERKGKRRKGERGKEEERDVEEQECKQVKKDATGWTVVTKNKRERKMVQIFVKVDGGKTSAMEVEMSDRVDDIVKKTPISDQDVYVTSGGRILRRRDKLESCEVRDGSILEVTSRMRGGGTHKDKKSKSEKKQTTNTQRPEQKGDGESRSGEGPELIPMDEAMRRLEESEEFQKNMECVSEGSEGEVQQKVQNYLACMQKVSWMNKEQFEHLESGVWQAVEARRKGRDEQQEQRRRGEQEQWRQTEQGQNTEQEQSKKGKQVRFGEEQQLGKMGAENAGEPEVMGRTTEVRTGRGSTGLVRGGDERFRVDETNKKGKGKGNGGKGEHEGKGGGFGHNGKQQEMRKKEEERVRMAPNMGAGGSHPQATSDPGEGEMAEGSDEKEESNQENGEEKEETRAMRWADCEDDDVGNLGPMQPC